MGISTLINHVYKVLVSKDLYYINPINLYTEKRKFLDSINKNSNYNPLFSYRKIGFNPKVVENEIKRLKEYSGPYKEIIRNFALRSEKHLFLTINRGRGDFTKYSVEVYGRPDKKAINYSKKIIKVHRPVQDDKSLTAAEAVQILSKRAKRYNWRTSLSSNLVSRIQLHHPTKTMHINRNALFSRNEIKRLEVHEIDTHIRRGHNNDKYIKQILQKCFNHIETEEGLAVKNEEINNCLDYSTLRNYAARLLAVEKSLNKGFWDVFKEIRDYGFSNEDAFTITSRVKRGLSDTKKPGCFTRDHIYISGKLKIDRFLTKNHKLDKLFIGKIGVNDVASLEHILKT